MNTENQVVTDAAPVTQKVRGRKRNPANIRTIYLNADNTPRKKGAPKVGSQVKAVDVQWSVKNNEFNYNTTPFTNERMVTISERQPRKAKVVNVIAAVPVAPVAAPAIAEVVEAAPVGEAAMPIPAV